MLNAICDFNSIKVRLERIILLVFFLPLSYFNSIKVRLEPTCPTTRQLMLLYFNSIKVRLERCSAFITRKRAKPFQFHKGTIRTGQTDSKLTVTEANFNSIKVRLEPSFALPNSMRYEKFQFHKGTIRTFSWYCSLRTCV